MPLSGENDLQESLSFAFVFCFCIYFPCRLGEVTLKDFKAAIDREGSHRYHFKALDPEFGTVKEEVNVGLSFGISVTTQPWGPWSPHF